jgi:hypothetical protein
MRCRRIVSFCLTTRGALQINCKAVLEGRGFTPICLMIKNEKHYEYTQKCARRAEYLILKLKIIR